MCCGEERINLPNSHTAANPAGVFTPGNHRLSIAGTSAKPQVPPRTSGLRIRGPITGRYRRQRP